jgi:hypothetical protein
MQQQEQKQEVDAAGAKVNKIVFPKQEESTVAVPVL